MPGFSAPWWLLGLAVVFVVRRLHRVSATTAASTVSALFLWEGERVPDVPGRGSGKTDPRWRRRALLAALLVVALADPRLEGTASRPITLWVDDRPSLYTVEDGSSRFTQGLAAVRAAAGGRDVQVRSLTRAGRGAPLPRAGTLPWPDPGARLALPAADAFPGTAEAWLLADGSDPALATWAARMPFARLLGVGRATENVALSGLALRVEGAALVGQATVLNAGRRTAERQLSVEGGGAPLRWRLVLEPGKAVTTRFRLDSPPGAQLVARLDAGDALALDDRLELATAPLARQPVRRRGRCPAVLERALNSHPGLGGDGAAAVLTVACGGPRPAGSPALWIAPTTGASGSARPAWSTAADRLRAVAWPAGLRGAGAPYDAADGIVLAWAGDGVAVTRVGGPGPAVLGLHIDLDQADLSGDAAWPLLVDALLAEAAGRPLLDRRAGTARDPALATIAPGPLPVTSTAPRVIAAATDDRGLATWLLLGALLLALLEALAGSGIRRPAWR